MIEPMILTVLIAIFLVLTYAELFRGSSLERRWKKYQLSRARVREARKRGEL